MYDILEIQGLMPWCVKNHSLNLSTSQPVKNIEEIPRLIAITAF